MQVRADKGEGATFVAALDHAATRACVELERAFLAEVGGGCGSPVAAYARPQAGGWLFEGFFAADGASTGRRATGLLSDVSRAEAFIRDMAKSARGR